MNKATSLLRRAKRYIGLAKNKEASSLPVELFYANLSDSVMNVRKEHGNDFNLTEYMTATPEMFRLSRTIANKYVDNLQPVTYTMQFHILYFGGFGYFLRPSNVCRVRSGMEFFFTSFADIPVSNRDNVLFKNCIAPYSELLKEFDEALKHWTDYYQFKEDEIIPTNIPESHWWWKMTAEDKQDKLFIS